MIIYRNFRKYVFGAYVIVKKTDNLRRNLSGEDEMKRKTFVCSHRADTLKIRSVVPVHQENRYRSSEDSYTLQLMGTTKLSNDDKNNLEDTFNLYSMV